MALAFTIMLQSGSNAPGAATQATASLSCTSGRAYFVFCVQTKGVSIDPNYATLTGASQTWTEITTARNPWTASGTTRRRSQVFYTSATSTASGALTFAGLNTPDTLDWQVVEVTGAHTSPYVTTNVVISTNSPTVGTLIESSTMAAASDTDNRWLNFVAVNTNSATLRGELVGDVGGDATQTLLGRFNSATTRTRTSISTWLNALPSTDLTPGFVSDTVGVGGQTVLEVVEFTAGGSLTMKSVSRVLYVDIKSVSGLAIAGIKSVAGLLD